MDPNSSNHKLEHTLEQSRWLKALAVHLVGPDNAEDLLQDAWVRALERPPRQSKVPPSWMARVLTNLGLNSKRKDQRRRRREILAAQEQTSEMLASDEAVEVLQVHEQLVHALRDLREPYRTAVILRFYEGLSSKQIAKRLQVPPSTARNRLAKGLAELRRILESRHGADWRDSTLTALFLTPGSLVPPSVAAIGLETVLMTMNSKLIVGVGAIALIVGFFFWPENTGTETENADGIQEAELLSEIQAEVQPSELALLEKQESEVDIRAEAAAPNFGVKLRIVDETGTAIPSARIRVFKTNRGARSLSRRPIDIYFPNMDPDVIAITNQEGIATIGDLPRRTDLAFFADASGFAGRVRVENLSADPAAIDLGDWILESGRFLALQFVDSKGNSIPSARVECIGRTPQLEFTMLNSLAFTDENGVAFFENLNKSANLILTDPAGFLSYQERDFTVFDQPTASRRIVLERGGSIELTVYEEDGSPAKGVGVYKEVGGFQTPLVRLQPHLTSFQGVTAADGKFLVSGLEEERASHGIAIRRGQAWAASAGMKAGEKLNLVVPGVHEINGRILLRNNTPAAGGTVILINENEPSLPPDFECELGDDGSFSTTLSTGSYRIASFHKSGTLMKSTGVLLEENIDLGDLHLADPTALVLRIENGSGEGLPAAKVSFPLPQWATTRPNPGNSSDIQGMLFFSSNPLLNKAGLASGEVGVWNISHLPTGSFTFQITCPGYQAKDLQVELAAGQTVHETIQLEATAELILSVMNSDGRPASGVSVAVSPAGHDSQWQANGLQKPKYLPQNSQTDKDGKAHFKNIGVGSWNIGRWLPSRSGFFWGTTLINPGSNHFQIQMPELHGVEFKVVGPNGPVPETPVRLRRKLPKTDPISPITEYDRGGYRSTTDQNGICTHKELEADEYQIQIFPPGLFPLQEEIQINASSTSFTFRFTGTSISGAIANAPQGSRVYLANFLNEPDEQEQALLLVRSQYWDSDADDIIAIGSNLRHGMTSPDSQGFFEFNGVPDGIYYLIARAPGYIAANPRRIHVKGEDLSNQNFVLAQAGSVSVELTGMTEFRRRHPETQLYLEVSSLSGKRVSSNPPLITQDGKYSFSPLESGEAIVSMRYWNNVTMTKGETIPVVVIPGQASVVRVDARNFSP